MEADQGIIEEMSLRVRQQQAEYKGKTCLKYAFFGRLYVPDVLQASRQPFESKGSTVKKARK